MASSCLRFLDHTQRHITVGRTSLDEWSARSTDLYLTTHNTHNRQTIHAPGGIRIHDLGKQRPQNYALDRAATGTGLSKVNHRISYAIVINLIIKTLNRLCFWPIYFMILYNTTGMSQLKDTPFHLQTGNELGVANIKHFQGTWNWILNSTHTKFSVQQ